MTLQWSLRTGADPHHRSLPGPLATLYAYGWRCRGESAWRRSLQFNHLPKLDRVLARPVELPAERTKMGFVSANEWCGVVKLGPDIAFAMVGSGKHHTWPLLSGQVKVLEAIWQGTLEIVLTDDRPVQDFADTTVLSHSLREKGDAVEVREQMFAYLSTHEGLDRLPSLLGATAVSEAAMNALQHGGGGWMAVGRQKNHLLVHIQDDGPGISIPSLAWALLHPREPFGIGKHQGFWFMLNCGSRCTVTTGVEGTAVTLTLPLKKERP